MFTLNSSLSSSTEYKHPKRANISMFFKASSSRFNDSSFNVYLSADNGLDPLKTLNSRVASNAILNAGGRADRARCYPGTREKVISQMERWMNGQVGVAPNIMWLSGPAGAGKSAIVQTIAQRCKEIEVQAASFFFFRADSTRNTSQPLVATLLHQILEFHPPARRAIATVLSTDPHLLHSSIPVQFNKLLSAPLQDYPPSLRPSSRRPIVLLIDGLDECDSEHKSSQTQIIQALDRLVTPNNSPFLVLVASRAEPQILMAFNQLASRVQSIFLDDRYNPEKDILLFVTAQFQEIKRSHRLAPTLSSDWPSHKDIEDIVKKSSGQFIFPATLMRYIATSSASPILSLEQVKFTTLVHKSSPFAYLDAIYKFILSQAHNLDVVLDILSMQLLFDALSVRDDMGFSYIPLQNALHTYNPDYTPQFLHGSISDLTSIMHFDKNNLVFYHASLPDFLMDQSRSGDYYADIDQFGTKILPAIWVKAPESLEMAQLGLYLFNALKMSTPNITNTVLSMSPVSMDNFALLLEDISNLDILLSNIYRLYYPHNLKSYKQMIYKWVFWYTSILPKVDLESLETSSLPYVSTYIRISQTKHFVTRIANALFHAKH